MQPKTPSESRTVMTDLVLPSETNPLNNLFGGELLARMDRAARPRHHARDCIGAEVYACNSLITEELYQALIG